MVRKNYFTVYVLLNPFRSFVIVILPSVVISAWMAWPWSGGTVNNSLAWAATEAGGGLRLAIMFLSPLHSGWAKLSWVCQNPISPGEALISLIGSSSPPFLPPEPISAISGCMSAIEAGLLEMLEPCWVTI